MAGNTAADCSMKIRLLINKKTRRVVYAEAGKDFVDLLLAFLLLPTGAIIRILREHGTASSKSLASIGNLYSSVDKLDAAYMITDKSILLKPDTPFNDLPLLQYGNTPRYYYACSSGTSTYGSYKQHQISTQTGRKCICGQEMKDRFQLVNHLPSGSSSSTNTGILPGYVKEAIQYIITDDLNILPISTITSITELNKVQVKDISQLQEVAVTVGSEKVLELLRASLVSKTALNDVFSPRSLSASHVVSPISPSASEEEEEEED